MAGSFLGLPRFEERLGLRLFGFGRDIEGSVLVDCMFSERCFKKSKRSFVSMATFLQVKKYCTYGEVIDV